MNARFISLRILSASLLCLSIAVGLVGVGGCSKSDSPKGGDSKAGDSKGGDSGKPDAGKVATGKKIPMGFIYVGPKDDYGYNQAHAEGAAAVKKLGGVKVYEQEKVPENIDVQKTMISMIDTDGAKLIFPTSFGYFNPHVLEMAKKYPEVMFLHCGGLWSAEEHPKNVGSYFGFIDETEYLSGMVAANASKSKKLGFVAAKGIPQVLRNINAYALGAQSVDPKVTVDVIFTNDWSDSNKEAEATNTLLNNGCDVITCHVDSPKVVVENAVKRGAYVTGYHANQMPLAKDKYLTGSEWNWAKVYTDYVNDFKDGKTIKNMTRGGIREGIVKLGPFGKDVTPATKDAVKKVEDQFLAGTFVIFKGPLEDNAGKLVIPDGEKQGQLDQKLEKMNYLVKGVNGKV